jgi:hypothetical protein
LVIFAHGSGSTRFSTRSRQVAISLRERGFATLVLDLLASQEEAIDVDTAEYRFDIARLGLRVSAAADWAANLAGLRADDRTRAAVPGRTFDGGDNHSPCHGEAARDEPEFRC